MKDPEQVFFYRTNTERATINRQLHIKPEWADAPNCVALADTAGTVVQVYNLDDGKQLVRLVEHIAILRPKVKERKEGTFLEEREF